MQARQYQCPKPLTSIGVLGLGGVGQNTLPRLALRSTYAVTNLHLSGFIFYDDRNLTDLLRQRLHTLTLVDCSVVVQIEAFVHRLCGHQNLYKKVPNSNRYEVSLRWHHIFAVVQSSSIKNFGFFETQHVNGEKGLVEGINPDTHYRYKAFKSNEVLLCPLDLRTTRTTTQDAVALMKLHRSRGCYTKAKEIYPDYEEHPLFLELAGDLD